MNKQEFINRFNALVPQPGAQFNTTEAMSLLNEVTKDYEGFEESATIQQTLKSEIASRDKDIESLRQSNYKLFMTVGNTLNQTPDNAVTPPTGLPASRNDQTPEGFSMLSEADKALDQIISQLAGGNETNGN